MSIIDTYTINGVYGSLDQDCLIYVAELDEGGYWYAVDGSENVNLTYNEIILEDGVSVENPELEDVDCFTLNNPVNSEYQFQGIIAEYIGEEEEDEEDDTDPMQDIVDSVINGNYSQAREQFTDLTEHDQHEFINTFIRNHDEMTKNIELSVMRVLFQLYI